MESPDHGGSSQGGRGTEHRAARCCARCVCWGEVPVGSAPAAVIRANSERLSSKRFHKLIVMTPARYFPPPRYRRLRAMPAANCRCNCRHMACAGEGTASMVAPTDEQFSSLPNPVRLCPSENFGQDLLALPSHCTCFAGSSVLSPASPSCPYLD